jgi:type IV pilus assembly protein PilV
MTAQQGFSLLEVLIAALVLAIGLLGLAALQASGLQSGHASSLHSQATLLAYDIADRMRANQAGYRRGFYRDVTAADRSCTWSGSQPAACTPLQMAQHDIWEWNAKVAARLPQGVGTVCRDSSPNDGGDTDGDGTVEASEYACDDAGDSYIVKLWFIDGFGVDDQSGDAVSIISRVTTEIRP